jgi:glycosidase
MRAAAVSAVALATLGLTGCVGAGVPPTSPAPPLRDTSAGIHASSHDVGSSWLGQVVYLVMPDRFENGDPGNDEHGAPGCFDRSNPSKFHGGDLAGLRKRIPYLRELGVTAVWITPPVKQSPDRCGYHGYWADFAAPDDGAVEPELGTADDLRALAADLHAAGMRLVLDMVVNHAGREARVVAQHPDWFHDPRTCAQLGDAKVYCPVGGKPLPDFAQENPAVSAYLTSLSVSWLARSGADAIRMDTVKHVLPSYWASSWFPAVREAHPGVFVVGEVFDQSGPRTLAPYLDEGFDSLFDYPRRPAMLSVFTKGGSVDALADVVAQSISTYGVDRAKTMMTFLDNHDVPRFASEFPAGTSDEVVERMSALAEGALFTLPGIPQLTWGDELAMRGGADPDNRHDMPAWAWSAESRRGTHPEAVGDGQAAFARAQKLIALRKAHPALQGGSYEELARKGTGAANVLAFERALGGDRVVVVINPGEAASVVVPVKGAERFVDRLGEGAPSRIVVASGSAALALPARTMGLYVPDVPLP